MLIKILSGPQNEILERDVNPSRLGLVVNPYTQAEIYLPCETGPAAGEALHMAQYFPGLMISLYLGPLEEGFGLLGCWDEERKDVVFYLDTETDEDAGAAAGIYPTDGVTFPHTSPALGRSGPGPRLVRRK